MTKDREPLKEQREKVRRTNAAKKLRRRRHLQKVAQEELDKNSSTNKLPGTIYYDDKNRSEEEELERTLGSELLYQNGSVVIEGLFTKEEVALLYYDARDNIRTKDYLGTADDTTVTSGGGAKLFEIQDEEGHFHQSVKPLIERVETKLTEMLYSRAFRQKRQSVAVQKFYLWNEGDSSAAEWLHANSMYRNNLTAMVCLSSPVSPATRVLPYDRLMGDPLIAVQGGMSPLPSALKERFKSLYTMSQCPFLLREVYNNVMKPAKKDGFQAGDVFVFCGDLLHADPPGSPKEPRLFLLVTLDVGQCHQDVDFHKRQVHAGTLMEAIHGSDSAAKLDAVATHCAVLDAPEAEIQTLYNCSWSLEEETMKPASTRMGKPNTRVSKSKRKAEHLTKTAFPSVKDLVAKTEEIKNVLTCSASAADNDDDQSAVDDATDGDDDADDDDAYDDAYDDDAYDDDDAVAADDYDNDNDDAVTEYDFEC